MLQVHLLLDVTEWVTGHGQGWGWGVYVSSGYLELIFALSLKLLKKLLKTNNDIRKKVDLEGYIRAVLKYELSARETEDKQISGSGSNLSV